MRFYSEIKPEICFVPVYLLVCHSAVTVQTKRVTYVSYITIVQRYIDVLLSYLLHFVDFSRIELVINQVILGVIFAVKWAITCQEIAAILYIYIYIYIYIYSCHPAIRVSLDFPCHSSLSSIASGRFSRLHPAPVQSCCR